MGPKKRDRKGKKALRRATAALFALCKEKPESCPTELGGVGAAWTMVLSKLPLRVREDEARNVHEAVADLMLAQHSGMLGTELANLGQVCSILAEVCEIEGMSTK